MTAPRYAVENLSILSCDVTGKPVVVLVGRSGRQEDGYILHNIGSMPEYPDVYVIEISKYFSPEEMVEPLTKAWATLLGGKPNKQNMLRLGKGKNKILVLGMGGEPTEMEAMEYSRTCLMTPDTKQKILDCGWSAITRPAKKSKVKKVTFPISINGITYHLPLEARKVDADGNPEYVITEDSEGLQNAIAEQAERDSVETQEREAKQAGADAADQGVGVLTAVA